MKPRIGFYYKVLTYKEPVKFEGIREYTTKYGVFRFSDGAVVRIDVCDFERDVKEYNP